MQMLTSSDMHDPSAPQPAHDPGIALWHLADGGTCLVGAQPLFNVLGAVEPTDRLFYRLNGGPERTVVVNAGRTIPRLQKPGHFSIDTIGMQDLQPDNVLELLALGLDHRPRRRTLRFSIRPCAPLESGYRLDFDPPGGLLSVAQVVEGRWTLRGSGADRHLALPEAASGYDRVLLLGTLREGQHVSVEVRLTIDRWTSASHAAGFVFGWQGHPSGLGQDLPQRWTTGLAYYTAKSQGLLLRLGRDVSNGTGGERIGDQVLAAGPLHTLRRRGNEVGRRLGLDPNAWSQWRPGRPYVVRMEVRDRLLVLSAWADGGAPRHRPLHAVVPGAALQGGLGLLLHHAAARVHDVRVDPA